MRFRDLSFRTALALLASAVTTAALLVLALMLAFQFIHSWEDIARQRAVAATDLLTAALLAPMIERNYAAAAEVVKQAAAADDIAYIRLEAADGREIAHAGAREPDGWLPSAARRISIAENGLVFGWAEVQTATAPIAAALRNAVLAVILAIAAAGFLAALVFRGVAQLLSRDMEALTHATRAIAAGDWTARARIGGRGEMGELADAFNRMTQQVGEHLAALTQAEARQRELADAERREHGRLMSLFATLGEGLLFADEDGRVRCVNPAFLRLWGLDTPAALIGIVGRPAARTLAAAPVRLRDGSAHALAPSDEPTRRELALADGREIVQTALPVRDDAGHIGHLWVFEDVTREREQMRQLAFLADRDTLTQLYNRRSFARELERAVADAARLGGCVAVFLLDLDEFKEINDSFGHAAGDALLVRLAGALSATIRQNETLARLGGDEFALIASCRDSEEIQAVGERLVQAVARTTFPFEDKALRLSASIGISRYPADGETEVDLLAKADAAMYQAKQSGRNAVRVYQADDGREGIERLAMKDRLAAALEHGHFELHYQGVWRADGELSHLEALLRLVGDDGVLVQPAQFIPLAESSGHITEIDGWVLDAAIARLAAVPSSSIAVNVSGRTVREASYIDRVAAALQRSGVAPQRLIVEITETAAVGDFVEARAFIQRLRDLGCRIALDDFGAGYSSFVYLKHLRADLVKIDGQFIRNLAEDRENQVFVRAIAEVARGMGAEAVAEFVESADTARLLPALGVHLMQGRYFDAPRADPPSLAAAPPGVSGRAGTAAADR